MAKRQTDNEGASKTNKKNEADERFADTSRKGKKKPDPRIGVRSDRKRFLL